MHNKKFTFSVLNRRKCISNLRTLPNYIRQDFAKYRTQKVLKVIVLNIKDFMKIYSLIQLKTKELKWEYFNESTILK